jgi:hypothetical protein
MEKVIRDGKVAILISGGFGAGWYSWNDSEHKELLFHPKLVEMVEENRTDEITEEWVEDNLGIKNVYCGGVDDLSIRWVPIGSRFFVDEYDGSESLIIIDTIDYIVA